MAIMTDIENSAVIQNAKAAYDAAKAAGDTAGMAAAHAAANAYRESAGGYTHYYEEGAGTNYQVIYSGNSGSSSAGSPGSSGSGSASAKTGSGGSIPAATQKTTIIDSTYNPEYYSDAFSEGKSLLSVGDDVLGYGLMAFVVVALVSKLLR